MLGASKDEREKKKLYITIDLLHLGSQKLFYKQVIFKMTSDK